MLWADSRICGFADSHVGFTFCGRYAERGLGIQSVFFFPPTAFPSSSADPPVVGQARLVTFDRSKVTKKPCTLRQLADRFSLFPTLNSPYTPALVPLPTRSLSNGD